MLHSKNGTLTVKGSEMPYIRFGSGKRHLIMLPGLGDGLTSVAGKALPMAWMYRSLAKAYTVWKFSRRRPLPEGASTADMAADLAQAMEQLGIEKADVIGVSMGGMIAQHLAALYPERIEKLILTVTIPKSNEMLDGIILHWLELSEQRDIKQLLIDTSERTYTGKQLEQYRLCYPLLALYPKPKNFRRFQIMARACMTHNATDLLKQISAETLVVGAAKDQIVGVEGSSELAEAIPNARCHIFEQYGHGVYDESNDFQKRVLDFLK